MSVVGVGDEDEDGDLFRWLVSWVCGHLSGLAPKRVQHHLMGQPDVALAKQAS